MNTSFIPAPLLSKRQLELCEVIERLTRERGYAPSLVEVAAEMRIHASRAHQLAITTERKGRLTRTPGVARSWRVVRPDVAPKARRPKS